MRKKIRRKKGPVQSKKISYDGINFASGLEKYMYMALRNTPDFVGKHFIIETKGRANESFPLRWKLFKKLIAEDRLDPFTLYKPQNHKECDETVQLIINKQKEYASMGN